MKYIIFAFFFPFSLICQKKYAPLNTEWHYEEHELYCNGNHIDYIVEKETIIDNKDCSVIYAYTSNDLDIQPIKLSDSLIVWENDSKIYFLEDSTFYLLFDFNVQLGDTLTFYEPINKSVFSTFSVDSLTLEPSMYKSVITNIELINVSNSVLRKFDSDLFSSTGSFMGSWFSTIENIGSLTQKLTVDKANYIADGCFGGLQCHNNGLINYETDYGFTTPNPNCDIINSIANINSKNNISIFPNPANGILNIETKRTIDKINIINLNGQLIKSFSKTKEIDIYFLESGFYLISFEIDKITQYLTFIKR